MNMRLARSSWSAIIVSVLCVSTAIVVVSGFWICLTRTGDATPSGQMATALHAARLCEAGSQQGVSVADREVACLSGEITREVADHFLSLKIDDNSIVVVNSLGGDLVASLDMADAILARRLSIVVDGDCVSGCAFLFLAGREKYVLQGSLMGFHGGVSKDSAWVYNGLPSYREIARKHAQLYLQRLVEHQAAFFNRIGVNNSLLFHAPSGAVVDASRISHVFWEYGAKTLHDKYGVAGIKYFATPADLTLKDRLWYILMQGLQCKQFGDDAWVCTN